MNTPPVWTLEEFEEVMKSGADHSPEEKDFIDQLHEAARARGIEDLYRVLVAAGCVMTPEQFESFGEEEMREAMLKYSSISPMNEEYFKMIRETADQVA